MSKRDKRNQYIRRQIRKSVKATHFSVFNALCGHPFKERLKTAWRIICAKKLTKEEVYGKPERKAS